MYKGKTIRKVLGGQVFIVSDKRRVMNTPDKVVCRVPVLLLLAHRKGRYLGISCKFPLFKAKVWRACSTE